MQPEPLPIPIALYKKAVKLKIKTITLNFSGGHDEGMVTISTEPSNRDFEDEIQEWVWKDFDYNFVVSGYGNGLDYEDRITYDVKKKTATTWGFTIERVGKKKTKYVEKETKTNQLEVKE